MTNSFAASTFTASVDDMLGDAALLGSAEIARGVCRGADRTVSVLALTTQRMRRIDTWLGATGFVTHAAAPNSAVASIGTVCDHSHASRLVREIVTSLVGPIPREAAAARVELAPLAALSPSSVRSDLEWIVVWYARSARKYETPRCTLFASSEGLLVGEVKALDQTCHLDPCDSVVFDERVVSIFGETSPSVSDLLSDD